MTNEQVELFKKIINNIQQQLDNQDKRINKLAKLIHDVIEKQDEINKQADENIMILRDSILKLTTPFPKK